MRLVYFDEAGIGSPDVENYVVVAGVIVDADKQWRDIETHLRDLAVRFVLAEDRKDVIFHATDIHSGKRVFDSSRYSRELRKKLLLEICSIPLKFNLPVAAAYVNRAAYRDQHPELSSGQQIINAQAIASISCACQVEKVLRNDHSSDEVAVLVYENNDVARNTIKETHNFFRSQESLERAALDGWNLGNLIPFAKIIDTAHFALKKEAPILQVADAVVFALSRQLNGRDSENYALPISEKLIMRLRDFGCNSGCV